MTHKAWQPARTQLVKVKSPSAILATLDRDGKLDGLPFMPEMVGYCGAHMRVVRHARRTCVVGHGFRTMKDAVFLQASRCSGSHHGDCDRACLLFWKNAWLMPADDGADAGADATGTDADDDATAPWPAHDAAAADVLRRLPTRAGSRDGSSTGSNDGSNDGSSAGRYVCQSTELESATIGLHRWDIRPLLRELVTGELSLRDFVRIVAGTLRRRAGGGKRENRFKGVPGTKSRGCLDLRPGEWIEIKPIDELCKHLDEKGRNCGLSFPPTMHHAVGQGYQVAFPVRQIIIEQTGKMVKLSNTVALKHLLCEGISVANCPRAEYLYCRESWLRRVPAPAAGAGAHRG